MLLGLSDFPRVRWDSRTNCGFLQRNHCSHSQGKKMPGVYGQQNWNRGLPALGRGPETGMMEEMGPKFLESKPIDPIDFSESGSRPWPGLASLWLLFLPGQADSPSLTRRWLFLAPASSWLHAPHSHPAQMAQLWGASGHLKGPGVFHQ